MSLRVLVVDDEPDVMELFKRRFRREIRQGEIDFDDLKARLPGMAQLTGCRLISGQKQRHEGPGADVAAQEIVDLL